MFIGSRYAAIFFPVASERHALQHIGRMGGDSLRGIPYDGSLIINGESIHVNNEDGEGIYEVASDTPLSNDGTLSVLV